MINSIADEGKKEIKEIKVFDETVLQHKTAVFAYPIEVSTLPILKKPHKAQRIYKSNPLNHN